MRALGIRREQEFSPGKVEVDGAILDAVLAELRSEGFETRATEPAFLDAWSGHRFDLVLAMCQGEQALARLSAMEQAGAVAVNTALAIRNCYRDLLGAGLAKAGAPIPAGVLIDAAAPLSAGPLLGLEISFPLYVKRGDLHALSTDDVKRVENLEKLRSTLADFVRRGVRQAYLQQAVEGVVVKFYGVSGGEFFRALPERGELKDAIERKLADAAFSAASAIGLEAWGGDAVVEDGGGFKIVDFNDWPSYSGVHQPAAHAIARRAIRLLRRTRNAAYKADLS